MSDPSGVSEEQARAYREQLRAAPAEAVVTEVLSVLLDAAQVKIGRNDARLFIDLCAQVFEPARPYVSAEVAGHVDTALGQLRMAQVQAERAPKKPGDPAEPNDLPKPPEPTGAGKATPPPSQPSGVRASAPSGGSERPASKLWIPGRD